MEAVRNLQKLTKEGLLAVVELLEEEFETKVSDIKFDMYFQLLKEISDEQLKIGVINMLQNREYNQHKFPKVAEIREFTLGRKKDELADKAEIARDKLEKSVSRYGGYKSIAFDDPVIHAVVKQRFGGWISICKQDLEELQNFFKFEFVKCYKAYATKGIGLVDKVLSGRAELEGNQQLVYCGDRVLIDKWHNKIEQLGNGVNGDIRQLSEGKKIGL